MPSERNPDLKMVSSISGAFFVPSYQRGYRWTWHEVEALLDDIYAGGKRFGEEKYCLQPVVVKKKVAGTDPCCPMEGLLPAGEVYYELIDGQQRLTTLYLVYLYLSRIKPITPSFSLCYQTRPLSFDYLQNPIESQRNDNIDFYHIFDAYLCINEWFKETAKSTDDGQVMGVADDLYAYLRKQVSVIWYDAGEQDSITLFTRLNVGRIPLTNAELVKALLLAGRVDGAGDNYRQIEIATQWDMIERELHNDAFWSFLTNRPGSDFPTRIELLFDLLAKKEEGEKDRFFTFLVFKGWLTVENNGALNIWNRVLGLYHLLQEWFENRDLYHKVGYLVTIGEKLGKLVDKALGDRPLTKSGFKEFLHKGITDSLGLDEVGVRDLDYEIQSKKCESALLLFNVESVLQLGDSGERYPFHSHKKECWSLEHIHAQNAEPLNSEKEWWYWLQDSRRALEALPNLDKKASDAKPLVDEIRALKEGQIGGNNFRSLSVRIMDVFLNAEGANETMHSIGNLALLSGDVNSKLNNGAFQAKRLRIIDCDQNGKFIPICTRRVFFKYYTPAAIQQMYLWSQEDQEYYIEAILRVIRKYLKTNKPAAGAQS